MIYKVGFDIHGVIDNLPDFYSFLTDSIIKNGGEVHIITGGSLNDKLKNFLNKYNIKYTHIFSVYDYLVNSKINNIGQIKFSDGTIQNRFKDDIWDKVKGDYCKEHNISLHIDDSNFYGNYFTTPYAKVLNKNKTIIKNI